MTDIKNHCVSLETAKKLKKAGWPQSINSEYYWEGHRSKYPVLINRTLITDIRTYKEMLTAPIATEILEELPMTIKKDEDLYVLRIQKVPVDLTNGHKIHYSVAYVHTFGHGSLVNQHFSSLSEMLALTYIHLKQNKLI